MSTADSPHPPVQEPSDAIAPLIALADELEVTCEDLDDLIHEIVSRQATKINNGGLQDQISYLIDQLGPQGTRAALEDLRTNPLRDIADLRGSMVDCYTDDQVNAAFRRIEHAVGVVVVAVWAYYDGLVGGDSQFYILGNDGQLFESGGDLTHWLTGDPDDPETPADPGDPKTWAGAPAGLTAADLPYSDDMYNYALRSELS
jgi:hypothetical protein